MQRNETAAASAPAHAPDGERLPVLPAAELFELTGTEGLLATIQSKCGFSAEHFDRTVMPVLKAYAEFVQQLPAAGSRHDAQSGGLLIHTLEVVNFALTFRRGQILPKGAAPEDIMRLEHRWTYAVFVAALMRDIGKHIAELRVTLYQQGSRAGERWTPLSGTIAECGATRYRVEFVSKDERETALDGKLAVFLYQRLIPADALWWLSNDHELIGELMAVLAGKKDCGSGAIRELVLRANAESSKRNASAGSRAPLDRSLCAAEVRESADQPVAAAARCEPNAPEPVTEEYLDDFEDRTEEHAAKPGGSPVHPGAPKPQLPPPVALVSPAPPKSAAEPVPSAPPEAALRFMEWLKAGLAQGTLRFNENGAMVHFVKEGMLLVSPKIFQHFVSVVGEEGVSPAATASRDKKDLAIDIQRQLLKADWQVRSEKGRSIVPYHVLRGGKPGASIFGVVIAGPDRFVYPIPPANPHLVRADSSIKA
jgi:integrating conjugative element relaxase (TIGR03760 family)